MTADRPFSLVLAGTDGLFVAILFVLPALFLTSGIWIGPIAH